MSKTLVMSSLHVQLVNMFLFQIFGLCYGCHVLFHAFNWAGHKEI